MALPHIGSDIYHQPLRSYMYMTSGSKGGCINVDPLDFSLSPYKIGEYRICRMVIGQQVRGQGKGTKLMSLLCVDADVAGVALVLEASPYNDRTKAGVARLMRFYGRFGFVEIPGHPACMRRVPTVKP